MGVLVSTGVHYRRDGGCLPAQVLVDNPPDYNTLDLRLSIADGFEDQAAVAVNPLTFPASVVDGTWHYPGDCPTR